MLSNFDINGKSILRSSVVRMISIDMTRCRHQNDIASIRNDKAAGEWPSRIGIISLTSSCASHWASIIVRYLPEMPISSLHVDEKFRGKAASDRIKQRKGEMVDIMAASWHDSEELLACIGNRRFCRCRISHFFISQSIESRPKRVNNPGLLSPEAYQPRVARSSGRPAGSSKWAAAVDALTSSRCARPRRASDHLNGHEYARRHRLTTDGHG